MPRVNLAGNAVKKFTHGESVLEVEATTFRRLVLELDKRFPGLGRQVEDGMAIAIDGTIYQDAYATPLVEGSEIVLIPRIVTG